MTHPPPIPAHVKLEFLHHSADDRIAFFLHLRLDGPTRPVLCADIITQFYECPSIQIIGTDAFDLPGDHAIRLLRAMFKHMLGYLLYGANDVGRSVEWSDPDLAKWINTTFEPVEAEEILRRLRARCDPNAAPLVDRAEISVTIG